MAEQPSLVRRFTKLEFVLDLLRTQELVLLDPTGRWEDRNDLFGLKLFQERAKAGGVRACCFTGSNDTFHHWRIYGPQPDSVCIVFWRAPLTRSFSRQGVTFKPVNYFTVPELWKKRSLLRTPEIPFVKWARYQDEREYRALQKVPAAAPTLLRVKIDPAAILEIKTSPWTPEADTSVHDQLTTILRASPDLQHIEVKPCNTIDSAPWQGALAAAVRR